MHKHLDLIPVAFDGYRSIEVGAEHARAHAREAAQRLRIGMVVFVARAHTHHRDQGLHRLEKLGRRRIAAAVVGHLQNCGAKVGLAVEKSSLGLGFGISRKQNA